MVKPVQDSLQVVKQAQMEVNKTLSDPVFQYKLLAINDKFQIIIQHLVGLGAIFEPENAVKKEKAGPITRFMGKEIKRENVSATDLDPNQETVREHLKKVDKLYEQILFIQPSIILNSYTIPDDVLVLRHVAKRAGVANFKDRDLTIEFVEETIAGIKAKKEEAAMQKAIDDKNKNKGTEVTATQEMIDGSKFLQKEKVKPGDKVLQLPDGKFKVGIPAAV